MYDRTVTSTVATILLAALLAPASPAAADWLVTVDGQRVETRGAWRVEGKLVIFTDTRGQLVSLRAEEVDLEASMTATREAATPPPPPPPAPPPPPPAPPVLVLTDDDVGAGVAVPRGIPGLIARLEAAHAAGDVDAAMREVHWQGAPPEVRAAMREAFAWMMARPLTSIELVPVEPADAAPQEQDGRTFRPNLEPVGKLVLRLEPLAEDGDADHMTMTLLVGDRLGVPFLTAAVGAGDGP